MHAWSSFVFQQKDQVSLLNTITSKHSVIYRVNTYKDKYDINALETIGLSRKIISATQLYENEIIFLDCAQHSTLMYSKNNITKLEREVGMTLTGKRVYTCDERARFICSDLLTQYVSTYPNLYI